MIIHKVWVQPDFYDKTQIEVGALWTDAQGSHRATVQLRDGTIPHAALIGVPEEVCEALRLRSASLKHAIGRYNDDTTHTRTPDCGA